VPAREEPVFATLQFVGDERRDEIERQQPFVWACRSRVSSSTRCSAM
jgi:hypothetical protein